MGWAWCRCLHPSCHETRHVVQVTFSSSGRCGGISHLKSKPRTRAVPGLLVRAMPPLVGIVAVAQALLLCFIAIQQALLLSVIVIPASLLFGRFIDRSCWLVLHLCPPAQFGEICHSASLLWLCVFATGAPGHGASCDFLMFSMGMPAPLAPQSASVDRLSSRCTLQLDRSLAIPTVRSRPSTFWPLSESIAVLAVSGVANSTNPKPRDLPVSRSVMTFALVTSPCGAKRTSRSADVVLNARFPIWSLVEIVCSLRSSAPSGLTPGRSVSWRSARLALLRRTGTKKRSGRATR